MYKEKGKVEGHFIPPPLLALKFSEGCVWLFSSVRFFLYLNDFQDGRTEEKKERGGGVEERKRHEYYLYLCKSYVIISCLLIGVF